MVVFGGVLTMSNGDLGKVCLFSSIQGVITLNGEPAGGARLVRTVDLSGAKVDETIADERGWFEMPPVFARTITKYLPQEFVSKQKIVAHYEGQEYRIWYSIKRTPDENSEARGKPLRVTCELSHDETIIVVDGSPIHSLCQWDVEPDESLDTGSFFDE